MLLLKLGCLAPADDQDKIKRSHSGGYSLHRPSSRIIWPSKSHQRRKHLPLTQNIIHEPRFNRAFSNNFPKEYTDFVKLWQTENYPNYHLGNYEVAIKVESEEHWFQRSEAKRLDIYRDFFSRGRGCMAFWFDHDNDLTINDSKWLKLQEPVHQSVKDDWGRVRKSLRNDEDFNELEWPTTEKDLEIGPQIPSKAQPHPPPTKEDGRDPILLYIREYFVNRPKENH